MIIWKDDMPYVVKEIEDLKPFIDDSAFNDVEKFIRGYEENNKKIDELNQEISSLEEEVSGLESEAEELENALENMKSNHINYKSTVEALKDFIDVFDSKKLDKYQSFYYEKMLDELNGRD